MNRKPDPHRPGPEELRARKVKLAEGGIVFVLVLGLCVYLGIHFAQDDGTDVSPVAATVTAPDAPPAPVTVTGRDTTTRATRTASAAAAAAAAAPDGTEPADAAPAGRMASKTGDGDASVPPVREILPEVPELVTYSAAEAAFQDGRYTESAAMFAVYCAEHPGNAWGHYMHGLALRRAGRADQAREALQTALELKPDHLKSLVNLARVELDRDDAVTALRRADEALAIAPEHVPALRVRGRALHELGRSDAAEAAYLAALRLRSDDGWSLNNLALLYLEQERFERALAPLARAAELLPDAAVVHNNLGVALERTGHPAQALDQYALAADLGSGPGEVSALRLSDVALPEDPRTVDLAALARDWQVPGTVDDPAASATDAVAAVTLETEESTPR